MIKILFICHGNICRSTMAQFLFQHLAVSRGLKSAESLDAYGDFFVDSAATSTEEIGNPVDDRTVSKLKEHGIICGEHYARQVTSEDYKKFDLILLMDQENKWGIKRIIPRDPENKIHMILEYASNNKYKAMDGRARDVADPWYTHNFELTFQDLWAGCNGLLDTIIA